jgi:hypothetical protein
MSSKILDALKKEIAAREKELHALVDAANLVAATATGRGRKASFAIGDIGKIVKTSGKSSPGKGSGKRGRPKGSKNRPGAAKPGPKTGKVAVVKTTEKAARPIKKAAKSSKSKGAKARKAAAAAPASSDNA